ncbi:TPA: hypothetical protein RZK36_000169 [Campylobacter coli]|nr:hypothetical protein [Campylobacter coli]
MDYSRLPKEYDVFRCSHFYAEYKYYAEKNESHIFCCSLFF